MRTRRTLVALAPGGWLGLALACVVLGGCAFTALVRVAREDPSDPSRYVQLPGAQVSGQVTVFRAGRPLAVHLPQTLQPGDEVETAPGSVAVIRLPDLGEVLLDSATRIRVGSILVLFGQVLAEVQGFFAVESENVVAGVEGTAFALQVAPDRSVRVTVLDGRVVCMSKTRSWEPVHLTPGQQIVSGYPSRLRPLPVRASPGELERLRTWARRVEAAAPPPSPQGYCCAAGSVFPSAQNACRGAFALTEREARRECAGAEPGYCCLSGRVTQTTRSTCRGDFFLDRDAAIRTCQPPPEAGYCCEGGKVFQSTRDRCPGVFSTSQAEAARACRSATPQTPGRPYELRQLPPGVLTPTPPPPPPIR
ncbi:MAG TPA: FecR family protein [Candidatus Methylomirabilis sp.]|nr:FecR family protein [Candidatus Methylomirabilis sp.]